MDVEEIADIIRAITYKKGWYFNLDISGSRLYVQVCIDTDCEIAYDMIAKKNIAWKGGKHFLSSHMCRQEIVGTVFGAIRSAEEHEMKEWFRYKGASIYNPHLDPDALANLASKIKNFNVRENAMTMEE